MSDLTTRLSSTTALLWTREMPAPKEVVESDDALFHASPDLTSISRTVTMPYVTSIVPFTNIMPHVLSFTTLCQTGPRLPKGRDGSIYLSRPDERSHSKISTTASTFHHREHLRRAVASLHSSVQKRTHFIVVFGSAVILTDVFIDTFAPLPTPFHLDGTHQP